MYSTRVVRRVHATREVVYRALLDPAAVEAWRVPVGMTGHVHQFDAREGGTFRISLTYDVPTGAGKSDARTDTYHGRFVRLVPNEEVVEAIEFETVDRALQGTMTVTTTLADDDAGTRVVMRHDGVPDGIPPADNETGMRMALDNLARLVGRQPG